MTEKLHSPMIPKLRSTVFNPLWTKGMHSRLRFRHMIAWGTIVLSLTTFLTLMIYLTITRQEMGSPQEAARIVMLALIAVQGALLMLLGTGAVASGLTIEREQRLLDYQRLTPMSPVGKIVGYLFGLPIREYFLFMLTVPFTIWAVKTAEIPPGRALHFYGVFFCSVLIYHMTGMVAGMVAARPRLAAITAQAMVIILYVVLPRLSFIGLNFFEFLTIWPTLYWMIADELVKSGQFIQAPELTRYADGVAVFNTSIHPTTYTLIVQGFLLLTLFVVLFRKWCNEHSHPFSKGFCVFVYAGILTFLLGNTWPIVTDQVVYDRVQSAFRGRMQPLELLSLMMMMLMLICGTICAFLVHLIAPTRDTIARGYRRVRKLNLSMLNPNSDAASGSTATLMMIGLTVAASLILMQRAGDSGLFFTSFPALHICALPLLMFAGIILFVQAARERVGVRPFFVLAFVVWMLPVFTALVLAAAFELFITSMYVAMPFSPFGQSLSMAYFFNETAIASGIRNRDFLPDDVAGHAPALMTFGVGGYLVVGVVMQIALRSWRRRVKALADKGVALEAAV